MDLNLFKLVNYDNNDKDKVFFEKLDAKLLMDININKILENNEWIDQVIFNIPYLEKALNKPNKNIVTEEEIIKVELIKKVTVESIKHLAKNTQMITKFDEENDEVTPEKILNAYKEENYVTYENRFIYTLIKLIDDFIFIRTRDAEENAYKGKDYIRASYEANTRKDKKKVSIKFDYAEESLAPHKKSNDVEDKINEIKKALKMFKMTEIYKLLESKRATLVKPPLKMTNVLLKNVNFQYAVKLWNYLNDNFEQKSLAESHEEKYEEVGMTKTLVNEDFYFLHLIFKDALKRIQYKGKTKNAEEAKKEKQQIQDLFKEVIDKLIETSPELTQDEIMRLVTERYVKIQNRRIISMEIIEAKFKDRIEKYLSMVEELKLK